MTTAQEANAHDPGCAEAVLHTIVTHAGRVSEMAQQIAAAAEELSTSSDAISADISDVADITAKTSTDAQQLAATSCGIEIMRLT